MTETDHMSRMRGVSQGEGSPGRPPGRPMRQLEFTQAMSDFRHMFPETDEEVIEAVLRANNGMVDATIDQLLTMNIDAETNEDDDDLPDHILMSVERDVQQHHHQFHQGSRRSGRETRTFRKVVLADSPDKSISKDSEDCPPSYTEAVQSHLSHHHRSSNSRSRHRNSPTTGVNNGGSGHHSRPALGNMQHLLDLGPDTAPSAASGGLGSSGPSIGTSSKQHHHHSGHHHHNNHHHHVPRSSNHHRRRGEGLDGSPGKPRPGRNLLAPSTVPAPSHHDLVSEDFSFRPQRRGSLDADDFAMDGGSGFGREKSPHRWRPSHRESTSVKRPAYRNWNPPMLGTLPDDFLRISPGLSSSTRSGKHGVQLHRAMSAVGPERPHFYPVSSSPSSFHTVDSSPSLASGGQSSRPRPSSHKPHRSLSFAGHTSQQTRRTHPSGLAQHEFSSDILQERMKENERRRRMMTSVDLDPDLAQYLEDERLALMLQNSEFLQELRGDRMFMMTLERDQKSSDSDKPKQEPQPEPVTSSTLDEDRDFIEGYGDDRQDTLEAFPFSQQLPLPVSEDVELRKKLKNMGKASRKQFAALARRFFLKRRKKSAQQILKESQAPSMMNLLDEDDDDEEEDNFDSGEHNTVSESFTSSANTQSISTTSHSWNGQSPRQHFDLV